MEVIEIYSCTIAVRSSPTFVTMMYDTVFVVECAGNAPTARVTVVRTTTTTASLSFRPLQEVLMVVDVETTLDGDDLSLWRWTSLCQRY